MFRGRSWASVGRAVRKPRPLCLETLDARLALCALPHGLAMEGFTAAPLDDYSLVQTEYPRADAPSGPAAAPGANGLPMLESLPGAPAAVYLDFDGFTGNGYGGFPTHTPYDGRAPRH